MLRATHADAGIVLSRRQQDQRTGAVAPALIPCAAKYRVGAALVPQDVEPARRPRGCCFPSRAAPSGAFTEQSRQRRYQRVSGRGRLGVFIVAC